MSVLGLVGCAKQKAGEHRAGQQPAGGQAVQQEGAPGPAGGSLRRGIARQGVPTEIRQIALLYQEYMTTFNRAPRKLEDLEGFAQRDGQKLLKAIQDGYYTVVWNIPSPSSRTVVAYETNADGNGQHFVVMGDASVQKMTDQELQTALER